MSVISRTVIAVLAVLTTSGTVFAAYEFDDTQYNSSPDYVYRLKVYEVDSNGTPHYKTTIGYTYGGSTGQSPPSPYLYKWDVEFLYFSGGNPTSVYGVVEYQANGTGPWYTGGTVTPVEY